MAQIAPIGVLPQVSFPEFVDVDPAVPLNIAPILQMNEIQRQAKEKAQEGLDSQLDYLYKIQTPFTRDKETLQGLQNTVYAKANEFADGKYSVNEMHQQQRALKHQIMTSKDINKIVNNAKRYDTQIASREKLIAAKEWDPFGYMDKEMNEAFVEYDEGRVDSYTGSTLKPYQAYNEELLKLGKDLNASEIDLGKELNTFVDGEGNVVHTFNKGVTSERILGALSESAKQTMIWEYQMAMKHNPSSITINTYDEDDNPTGKAFKPFDQYVMDKVAPIAYNEFKTNVIGKGADGSSTNTSGSSTANAAWDMIATGTYGFTSSGALPLFEEDPFDTYTGLKASKAELAKTEENQIKLEAAYEAGDDSVWNDVVNGRKALEQQKYEVDNLTRSYDALKQAMSEKDPKFFAEFEKTASNLRAEQATLLTETQKGLWDKYGAAIQKVRSDVEQRKKDNPPRKGDTQTPMEARKKQVQESEEELKLVRAALGDNFSEAEYKQAVNVIKKMDGFKTKMDDLNDKLSTSKKDLDNSRILQTEVLSVENLVVKGKELGSKEEYHIGEMLNEMILDPSALGQSEIYVLANEVKVSSTDGANLSTRTTKSLQRGDRLNPANNEIPIGSIDDKTMKVVGLSMTDIPGKGIGLIVETYGPSDPEAEEGKSPKNALTGRFMVFPSKGNQSLMLQQVSGLMQRTNDERLRALSSKFSDRRYDSQLSEFLKYRPKDKAEMTFQIDENTEVTVQQHPSNGTDRNFKVEFTMPDPDSGELLRMEIPNPIHNLNAVETLLENFDTKKLIEDNIAHPESAVNSLGDVVPPDVKDMPDPYNADLFKTPKLRTFIGASETTNLSYNEVQNPWRNKKGHLVATDAIGKHQFRYNQNKPDIIKSLNFAGITDFSTFTSGLYSAEYAELASNPVTAALPAEDKKIAAAFLSNQKAQDFMMDTTIDKKYRPMIPGMLELSVANSDKHNGREYTVPEIVSLIHYGQGNAQKFLANGTTGSEDKDKEIRRNLKEVRKASGMTEVPTKREVTKVTANLKEKISTINSSPNLDATSKAFWNQIGNWAGVPYKSGGESTKGADCSGFCLEVLTNLNYEIPKGVRASGEMARASKAQKVGERGSVNELIAAQDTLVNGALVFVHDPDSNKIYHVAMTVEDDKGQKYLVESDSKAGGFTMNLLADKIKRYRKGATFSVGYFPRKK